MGRALQGVRGAWVLRTQTPMKCKIRNNYCILKNTHLAEM